jgi:nucleoside-diphosphate-sugar epimerase
MRVLVTGATGFVGRTLVPMLLEAGHEVIAATRSPQSLPCQSIVVGEIGPDTDWSQALQGIDAIVHLAARAHKLQDDASDPEQAFMDTNARGTENLVSQAQGRRFIFLSTIGVHGNSSSGTPMSEGSPIQPHDPYSLSKLKAEGAVKAGGSYTIIRPPLIYGKDAPGNLQQLCQRISSGKTLPLGNASGKRSMISVRNIGSLIVKVLEDERAVNQTFVVADEQPIQTNELIRCLAQAMGSPLKLSNLPLPLLKVGATLVGKKSTFDKLFGDLLVDASKVRNELDWQPPFDPAEDLATMARAYARP